MKKILIAEDNFGISEIIKEYLFQSNLDAICVYTGEDAISSVLNDPSIGLVLMDNTMPGMGGLEAAKVIKGIRESMPIICISTCEKIHEDYKKYFVVHHPKPINFKELISFIKEILPSWIQELLECSRMFAGAISY